MKITTLVALAIVLCMGCQSGGRAEMRSEEENSTRIVRKPILAGTWYPGDPEELRTTIQVFLTGASDVDLEGEIVAVISPHAGYEYSGQVAAWGYKQLIGKHYDTVVIIAPSHRRAFAGVSVFRGDAYETPIGKVEIEKEMVEKLLARGEPFSYVKEAHQYEHSIEIQLPFLQEVLGDFKLVPIVMGEQDFPICKDVSDGLIEVLSGKNVLLVASSDYSHYHDYETAKKLDSVAFRYIQSFDPEGLSSALRSRRTEACGGGPIATVLLVAERLGADRVQILKKANSGDVTGDKSQVVGYMSGVVLRSKGLTRATTLSEEDKKLLLRIARTSIEDAVNGKPRRSWEIESDALLEERGAFVTITEGGKLRGCIGHIVGIMPLWQAVQEVAESAALKDPRFPPVTPSELDRIHVEVSALTPLRKIQDAEEIQVGKHGLMIRRGGRSGLLLPQVATEYGWNREEFLEHTCLKAGLSREDWRRGAEIFVFSAVVFGEE